jgi:7-carboxy-7-deazaguanine synthase
MGTIFLRFGGCNLRCPGWPCDTLYAVLPEHRSEWTRGTAGKALSDAVAFCREAGVANVCLTGGEPFIQNHEALEHIVRGLLDEDISVEAFSNGQVKYPDWAFELVNFVMDWKLAGSGNPATELTEQAIKRLKPTDAVKFVIKDRDDFEEAFRVWRHVIHETPAQWWAGVVWGDVEGNGQMSESDLVDLIQQNRLPWNLNVQVHKYLWPSDKRGV